MKDIIIMSAGNEVSCISYRGGDMLLGYNDGGAEVFQETIILPAESLKVDFHVPRSHVRVSSTYFEVIVLL